MDQKTIILFNFDNLPQWREAEELQDYQFESTNSLEGVNELIDAHGPCIIMSHILTRKSLQQTLEILRRNTNALNSQKLVSIVSLEKQSAKVEKLLSKNGNRNFIYSDLSVKAITHKIKIWGKKLQFSDVNLESARIESKGNTQPSTGRVIGKTSSSGVKWTRSLVIPEDFWLSSTQKPTKVAGKWTLKLRGPARSHLQWKEQTDSTWVAIGVDDFKGQDGSWYFDGLCPEFDPKTNLWTFVSDSFHLYFKTGVNKVTKAKLVDGDLEVAKDSKDSLKLARLIDRTFLRDDQLEGKKSEEKDTFSKDGVRKSYMEGKGNTDHLEGHYKGELESENTDEHSQKSAELSSMLDDTKTNKSESQDEGDKLDENGIEKDLTESGVVSVRLASKDNNMVYLCELHDLFDSNLTVRHDGEIEQDHQFSVTVSMDYGNKKITIQTIGKIVEKCDDIYSLEIEEVSSALQDTFMSLYSKRQEKIFEFFEMAKGY